MIALKELLKTFPYQGKVEWIGTRPARKEPMISHASIEVSNTGLIEDRHGYDNKRAVTLIQSEHLSVISALVNKNITPNDLRRNIVVSGINLIALKGRTVQIGGTVLEITGPCAPCSRMEATLGAGGYNAMRGHGGVTARVISSGLISINNAITPKQNPPEEYPKAGLRS